jgi:hypothetical protein
MPQTTKIAVNTAVEATAKNLGISEEDALKLLVSKGMESMGARALSGGQSPVFAVPSPQPLIGHELTHVVQQQASTMQRQK